MKYIIVAIWAEFLKVRSSKVFYLTVLIFAVIPLMTGLMMYISQNPDIAAKLGIVGTKAKLFSENNWSGYFSLLSQSMASVGLIGFGFVTSWIFGREHSDRTIKDILALPVSRSVIVLAKLFISFAWCMFLALVTYAVGMLLGKLIGIPDWSFSLFIKFSHLFFCASLLTLLLNSPVAFLAGYSRGIIAPLGFVIFTLILANFVGVLGLGPYFPWAIPGLFSVAKESAGMQIVPASYIILLSTFILGYWATLRWWQHADHH